MAKRKRKTLTMDRAMAVVKNLYQEAKAEAEAQLETARQLDEAMLLISDPLVIARFVRLIERIREHAEQTSHRAGKLRDIATLGEPDNWRTMAEANGIHVPGEENEKP